MRYLFLACLVGIFVLAEFPGAKSQGWMRTCNKKHILLSYLGLPTDGSATVRIIDTYQISMNLYIMRIVVLVNSYQIWNGEFALIKNGMNPKALLLPGQGPSETLPGKVKVPNGILGQRPPNLNVSISLCFDANSAKSSDLILDRCWRFMKDLDKETTNPNTAVFIDIVGLRGTDNTGGEVFEYCMVEVVPQTDTFNLIKQWSGIQHDCPTCGSHPGGNGLTGGVIYFDDPLTTITHAGENDEFCILRSPECSATDSVVTYSLQQGNVFNWAVMQPVQYNCTEGPNDALNGDSSPSLSAHNNALKARHMFLEWAHTAAVTPSRLCEIRVVVNYGQNYSNAYWNGRVIVAGDGDGVNFHPFTTDKIMAHEIMHAFIDKTAGLIYCDESGAIHEGLAIFAGEAIRRYCTGNESDMDWLQFSRVAINPAFTRDLTDLAGNDYSTYFPCADACTTGFASCNPQQTGLLFVHALYKWTLAAGWDTASVAEIVFMTVRFLLTRIETFLTAGCKLAYLTRCYPVGPANGTQAILDAWDDIGLDLGPACPAIFNETTTQLCGM